MLNEIWKDISGYEGLYQISTCGRVKSLQRDIISKKGQKFQVEEKIIKPIYRSRNQNYAAVHLCRNSNTKTVSVHRLVAKAFIPNPSNLPFINHKDENPRNNTIENIEWCSVQYNNNYGLANAKRSASLKNGAKSKKVNQYTLDGKQFAVYPSTMEAKRQTGILHIVDVCNGKREKAGGYIWKYA